MQIFNILCSEKVDGRKFRKPALGHTQIGRVTLRKFKMAIQRKDFNLFHFVPYVLVLIFFIGTGFAQITFRRVYGGSSTDEAYSVDQCMDGGYIVTGRTHSFGNGAQVYLIKVDSLGDTLWTKNYGGSGTDWGMSVQQTADGGYIVAGFTNSFGDSLQIYLIKTDSLGDTLWTRKYGGPGNERGYCVRQTPDGGYIISGGSVWAWSLDPAYLLKTDSLGNVVWDRVYYAQTASVGMWVQQTSDGGYVMTGGYSVTPDLGKAFLIKTDSLGNTLWAKDCDSSWVIIPHSVQETTDGGYIIVCYVAWGGNRLIKTDSLGNVVWVRIYVGPNGGLRAFSGQQTIDGGYVVTGEYMFWLDTLRTVFLLKTDSIGDTLWLREYRSLLPGANARGNSVKQTMDGGYIIAGLTDWIGGSNVYLIKTDQDGNVAGIEESSHTRQVSVQPQLTVYPNPFKDRVDIRYRIPDTGLRIINLKIYDVSGMLVKSFNHLTIQPFNQIVWDGTDDSGHRLPSGVYFCRLEAGETVPMRKIIKLR